ncbi:nuclear transport factor 2 family protein [Hymenobacter sp. ASUV-10]|uniref:Nuclear transport factor 2 family protein n=1 Tax=Hymenobacter aranciens TaxID=3063996 RepID=A0ABT9B681_9BACT|nr:nuclear transport factor 2 family protein [Hymenobacter sp. ASUV-10]MDO7873786.1 nuclear transport factor 2 family protein [Hymenobacter sp. ASUV-10]
MPNVKKYKISWLRCFGALTITLFLAACTSTRPPSAADTVAAKRAIVEVLTVQAAAWNRGDLPGYMQGYWQSDSLVFIGKKGLTYGWQPTLANYQKSYPDKAAMGQLDFSGLRVTLLGAEAAQVVGRWHLARTGGLTDLQGHYLLVLRKVRGQWVIVADHSS